MSLTGIIIRISSVIQPGPDSPWQNVWIVSFNGRMSDESPPTSTFPVSRECSRDDVQARFCFAQNGASRAEVARTLRGQSR
jgi:hypothetical protein